MTAIPSPRLLIADDDVEILESHRLILKNQFGFQVFLAKRLDEIEEIISADGIDCIHSDILFDPDAKNPDWNKPTGLSKLSEIFQKHSRIPILVVSAYVTNEAKEKAKEYGIDDLIYGWYSKGVDPILIAFDTIKLINEKRIRRSAESSSVALEKWEKKPTPEILVDKIEEYMTDIPQSEKPDIKLYCLKRLVKNHLCDYFADRGGHHLRLAKYLTSAITMAGKSDLSSNIVIECFLEVTRSLKRSDLSSTEVGELKIILEKLVRIKIVPDEEERKQEIRTQLEVLLGRKSPSPIEIFLEEFSAKREIHLLKEVIKDMERVPFSKPLNVRELLPYLNFVAYQNIKEELKVKYPRQFVAFLDGEMVGQNPDQDDLIRAIYKTYDRTDVFITNISEEERVIKFRRPRRIYR